MHKLSAWFTRNPVAANLLMMLLLVAGFFTLQSIRIEGFPAIPPSSVVISTVYPGASADQVDRGISRKIEKALEGMGGIKKVSSQSEDGLSTVWVQKTSRTRMDRFQNEIQARVDALYGLPRYAERPLVTRDEFNVEALIIQVYGDVDQRTLQRVGRTIRTRILSHPKITKVTPFGLLPYETRIEVEEDKLRAFGIALTDVAAAIEEGSTDYKGGEINNEAGTMVIRADQPAETYRDFSRIPVMTLQDGSRVLVKDIATVVDGYYEERLFARYQGHPSVGFQVYTSKNGNLMDVSAAAHEVLEELRPRLPAGVEVDIWGEYSIYMKERLSLLAKNAWQGLLIVFCLLALFLNLKLAFWVAMGIPVSIAGTLVLMGDRFLGYSLNEITTFGIIIVLGILVDDAIVVGESVFEERSRIGDPVEGTIKGVHKVATATVFGCFTTIAAFYPLLLIDNELGKVFASFSMVVIIALLMSLGESKFILPAHLAGIRIDQGPPANPFSRLLARLQTAAAAALALINRKLYQPALTRVLQYRYAALILFLTVAVCGISLIANGWVRTVFFPEVPGQIITVSLRMRSGSPLHLTLENIRIIEEAAEELNLELKEEYATEDPPIARVLTAMNSAEAIDIYAELQPEKKRRIGTLETIDLWRDRVGTLEGAEKLSFTGSLETGGGFSINLLSDDEEALEEASRLFVRKLQDLEGFRDVRDDQTRGRPQIRLRIKPEAQHLGLTAADLASQIGDAFGGLEIQRTLRGNEEVKVFVKYEKERRASIRDVLQMRIRNREGTLFPLSQVATVESSYAPSAVTRQNGEKIIQVRASLDKNETSAGEAYSWIKTQVFPEIRDLYPQVSLKGAGELEEIGELQGGMKRSLLMIVLLIYVFLAVPLKSYGQPLVIMSVIPFGIVGAAIGHGIMGQPLSILSFFGMLAVMGVVVNDSLVMLTRFNEIREEGGTLKEALVQAGGSRFRAIILTTITTGCGLMPLLSETSEQAQYLIPGAISLAWGVLFATPVTLFVVPLLINLSHDLRSLWEKKNLAAVSPAEVLG